MHKILELINNYWKFDNNQQHCSNWHDKQDLLEAVAKELDKKEEKQYIIYYQHIIRFELIKRKIKGHFFQISPSLYLIKTKMTEVEIRNTLLKQLEVKDDEILFVSNVRKPSAWSGLSDFKCLELINFMD